MKKELGKWGNSFALRLPAKEINSLGWKTGDEIEISAFKNSLILQKDKKADVTSDILCTMRETIDRMLNGGNEPVATKAHYLQDIRIGAEVLLAEEMLPETERHYLKNIRYYVELLLQTRYTKK